MARVLILGAYGLIGAEIARKLNARGHEVVALGRDLAVARRVLPGYRWGIRDLRALTRPEDWQPIVTEVDFLVNCAGALQQHLRDDLAEITRRFVGDVREEEQYLLIRRAEALLENGARRPREFLAWLRAG